MPVTATDWTQAAAKFTANIYLTTLSTGGTTAPASGTVETWTVADAVPGTPGLPFYATIDGSAGASMEIVKVTAVSGTGNKTWTVTRGQSGTATHAHTTGSSVIQTTLSLGSGYQGGDGNVSVDLGSGRVLWSFNDPMISTAAGQARGNFPSCNNVLAIQSGYDLSSATVTFYPQLDSNGHPSGFFPDYPDADGTYSHHAVGAGIVLDGKLLLVAEKNSGGVGTANGAWAALIDNPAATPDNWNWINIPIWSEYQKGTGTPGYGSASLADPGDGWLYLWATQFPSAVGLYVSRVPRASAVAGDLRNPQWWCGSLGWNYEDRHRGIAKQLVAPAMAGSSMFEASQYQRADGKWALSGIGDNTHLQYAIMASGGPGGTFPAFTNVYTIPGFGQAVNYVGYAHPEQTWSGKAANDVLISYTPGIPSGGIATAPETYLPRFVKVAGI